MSKNQKIGIAVAIVIVLIILIAIIVGVNKNDDVTQEGSKNGLIVDGEKYTASLSDGTKINLSADFNSTKTYKNLEISNIQFTEKNGKSIMLADVTNKGNDTHDVEIVKLTMIGENGEEVTEIKPIIGEIKPGETVKLNASIYADVTDVKDFKIEEAE